jgi:hypothetical protein
MGCLDSIKEAAETVLRDRNFWLHLGVRGVLVTRVGRPSWVEVVTWVEIETSRVNPIIAKFNQMRREHPPEASPGTSYRDPRPVGFEDAPNGYAAMPPAPNGATPAGRPRTVAETIGAWREDYESGLSSEAVPFDLHVRVMGMDEVLRNLELHGGEA